MTNRNNFDLLGTLEDVTTWVDRNYEKVQQTLAPLTPIAEAMKKALARAGYKVPDNPVEIAALYSQLTKGAPQPSIAKIPSTPIQTLAKTFQMEESFVWIGAGALGLLLVWAIVK